MIADSHIPFACKAFSQLHGQLLARSPSLLGWVTSDYYVSLYAWLRTAADMHFHMFWGCFFFILEISCWNRCWRLFMIKLWNHNLLNGNTMNACNLIIDGFKNKGLDPKWKPPRWKTFQAWTIINDKQAKLFSMYCISIQWPGQDSFPIFYSIIVLACIDHKSSLLLFTSNNFTWSCTGF